LYRTEGIVMRRRDQGEADRILTLCTPLGKIEVNAKGARKVRSRKAGHVELFVRSNFVISRVRSSWDIVSQVEMVEPHTALRSDLMRGAYARYVVELLDRFFAAGDGGPALFDLLTHTLGWLCQDADLNLVARFYEQHVLGLAGFRPELFQCVGDHSAAAPLTPHTAHADGSPRSYGFYGFDPERGGAVCPDCYAGRAAHQQIAPLSAEGLWFLQECQRGPYSRLRAQAVAPALHAEVERVMQHYIAYHLEQGVKSALFLQRLAHSGKVIYDDAASF
jgi:DNA repair protein RecO (recombination protein O)